MYQKTCRINVQHFLLWIEFLFTKTQDYVKQKKPNTTP